MMTTHHDTSRPHDYFTYIPVNCNNHFSTETPLCSPSLAYNDETPSDPYNPLLAYRDLESPISSPKMSSNFLQLQTNAAHESNKPQRPAPRPTQNVLQTSDGIYSSSSSESSGSDDSSSNIHASSTQYARCSRCQRTPSIDVRTGQWNMIQYGLNLWYCSRCAGLVGLPVR